MISAKEAAEKSKENQDRIIEDEVRFVMSQIDSGIKSAILKGDFYYIYTVDTKIVTMLDLIDNIIKEKLTSLGFTCNFHHFSGSNISVSWSHQSV